MMNQEKERSTETIRRSFYVEEALMFVVVLTLRFLSGKLPIQLVDSKIDRFVHIVLLLSTDKGTVGSIDLELDHFLVLLFVEGDVNTHLTVFESTYAFELVSGVFFEAIAGVHVTKGIANSHRCSRAF
jgi:hypothetical protein